MKEIVGKNGLQILTFWRSLQTGKMSSSSTNDDRQTANAGNVRSRDLLPFAGKKYAVLNLSYIQGCETGATVYRRYPSLSELSNLFCRCHNKSSPFSSVF